MHLSSSPFFINFKHFLVSFFGAIGWAMTEQFFSFSSYVSSSLIETSATVSSADRFSFLTLPIFNFFEFLSVVIIISQTAMCVQHDNNECQNTCGLLTFGATPTQKPSWRRTQWWNVDMSCDEIVWWISIQPQSQCQWQSERAELVNNKQWRCAYESLRFCDYHQPH